MHQTMNARKPDESYDELLRDDFRYFVSDFARVLDLRTTPVPQTGTFDLVIAPKNIPLPVALSLCSGVVCYGGTGSLGRTLREIPAQVKAVTPYYVYPSFELPRFVIPLDVVALRFSLTALSIGTGIRGRALRLLLSLPGSLIIVRYLFRSHAVFISV